VYSSSVDVWALGVVLYEVIMNMHIPYFDARSAHERQKRILQAQFDFEAIDAYDMQLGNLLFHVSLA
jgi:serine/threonine protein kinase